jgi:phosphoribosylformylglycinamidine (FGAM) synthase-like enzyme
MVEDPGSWLVYIPFDTCGFRLGGSLLAEINGHNGGPAPQIMDADYFIDCYEVVRELVEDGIISAGISIGNGGLAAAAMRFCDKKGARLDISGIMSSYQENDSTRILFGEIPGVLIQIRDNDYDYFDSQMLLQDIAYYPLGHPSESGEGVRFSEKGRNGVAEILASLMGQASEGED